MTRWSNHSGLTERSLSSDDDAPEANHSPHCASIHPPPGAERAPVCKAILPLGLYHPLKSLSHLPLSPEHVPQLHPGEVSEKSENEKAHQEERAPCGQDSVTKATQGWLLGEARECSREVDCAQACGLQDHPESLYLYRTRTDGSFASSGAAALSSGKPARALQWGDEQLAPGARTSACFTEPQE